MKHKDIGLYDVGTTLGLLREIDPETIAPPSKVINGEDNYAKRLHLYDINALTYEVYKCSILCSNVTIL